uniref:Ig-like domain-containing protein n=1 Tax=Clastoptera arizonana TaxID=38151 RepID=A0A1B6EC96_9HEMI
MSSVPSSLMWLVFQWIIARTVLGACNFPAAWSGRWFQSGVQHYLLINSTTIETKGNCEGHEGDKFLVEDKFENCFRCVVIHEKHPNVLQYKETYCDSRQSLDTLCSEITGDAPLFSMFRYDAAPTSCPFRPPFVFTYNRGSGDCRYPVSRADACTEDSRLLLRYQACPDVLNSESTVEELVCLAWWKDGSTKYLVGQLQHKMATSDEDRYRCFVYEMKYSNHGKGISYDVAQSGDATCSGLLSPTEGSRTMKLTKVEAHHHMATNCRFPPWLTEHHQWHTLDHSKTFHFSPRNATLKINLNPSKIELKAVCHSLEQSIDSQVVIIAHITTGCQSGYVCLIFYRREGHVIELQQSTNRTQYPEDACKHHHYMTQVLPFTTLITTPKLLQCPFAGHYIVSEGNLPRASTQHVKDTVKCSQQYHALSVGCNTINKMEFHSQCDTEEVSAYSCHGDWSDSNASTRYLIASPVSRKSVGARRYCFVIYSSTDSNQITLMQVASVTDSCHRHVQPGLSEQYWSFNITHHGDCGDSGCRRSSIFSTLLVLASLYVIR